MDDLDDPYSLSLISLVMMLSMNLILSNNIIQSYKTYVIRRVRASVSAIMYELGSKSKNYYRMTDMSFWKLHDMLKDDINKKNHNTSRRSRKKRRKSYVINGMIHSSLRLSMALCYFAGGCPLDIALVHRVSPCKVSISVWK